MQVSDSTVLFRPMTLSPTRFRWSHVVATAVPLSIALGTVWAYVHQWNVYMNGVWAQGFLKQYAMAVDQYYDEWHSLPPIEDWRIVARRTPADPIPAPLFGRNVAPVQSVLWGRPITASGLPLVLFNPDVLFPEGTLFVVVDGDRLTAVDGAGVEHPIPADGIFVLSTDRDVRRFQDFCRMNEQE